VRLLARILEGLLEVAPGGTLLTLLSTESASTAGSFKRLGFGDVLADSAFLANRFSGSN
jgi:hypothetical protein